MAHKRPKGLNSLFMTGSSSLRVRPFVPATTEPQARKTLDQTDRACKCQSSWWSPSHSRRPGLNHSMNVARYPREGGVSVPATSSPISSQWKRGRGLLHAITSFSNTACLTPKSHQWEGVQVLEEDYLRENFVSRTADTSFINRRRQEGHKSVQLPPDIPSSPTTPSPLRNRPHRRRRNAGAMPRSGYDTTNMRVAANPRPAASAGGSGHPRNDRPKNDGNSNGGSGSGSRSSGRRDDNSRDDDDKGSKKTAEKERRRGSKDGGPTTEELIKTIDDVRIPMEGRGWTFWL